MYKDDIGPELEIRITSGRSCFVPLLNTLVTDNAGSIGDSPTEKPSRSTSPTAARLPRARRVTWGPPRFHGRLGRVERRQDHGEQDPGVLPSRPQRSAGGLGRWRPCPGRRRRRQREHQLQGPAVARVPGGCDPTGTGVQFIFGNLSRMQWEGNDVWAELCGSEGVQDPHAIRGVRPEPRRQPELSRRVRGPDKKTINPYVSRPCRSATTAVLLTRPADREMSSTTCTRGSVAPRRGTRPAIGSAVNGTVRGPRWSGAVPTGGKRPTTRSPRRRPRVRAPSASSWKTPQPVCRQFPMARRWSGDRDALTLP